MNKNQNGSAKVPKASNIELKGCQKRPAWSQKGANMSKDCSEIKPRSVRFFCYVKVFRRNGKNGHGALVGLTFVKGTSVETSFFVFEKLEKWFVVGLTPS